MSRQFRKHGWQHDSDCRLEKTAIGVSIVVSPPLPWVPPHSLADGGGSGGHYRAQRGAWKPAFLSKAIRWFRRHRGLTHIS